MQPPSLPELLKKMTEMGASDLHLATGAHPRVRVDGRLSSLKDFPLLTAEDTRRLVYGVLTADQKQHLEDHLELDFSFGIGGLARFRGNCFNQRGAVGAVFRGIPFRVRSLDALELPAVLRTFCRKTRGLFLVTGATGSGKSTTLAAMIDHINSERQAHVLTIEDPIEFLHEHRKCLVNQREVHSDTRSFAAALRAALRQDPDVVLIGELRDLETMEAALRIAETGHLTLGTLHTRSAASTIHRVIDVFPAHQQSQIRAQLSLVLEGIACQALVPRAEGSGRALAMEVMVPNAAIRNLIREDKVHQLESIMQLGRGMYGMQTFNQSLADLFLAGRIERDTALEYSIDPDELRRMLNRRRAAAIGSDRTAGTLVDRQTRAARPTARRSRPDPHGS
ncbi:MAG: type IV pilus twitching motility protein PilT [Acidobacteriota bacterium]|nr:type IV pilus twitching motility protein PilT [Acidobacteriota bacterium]